MYICDIHTKHSCLWQKLKDLKATGLDIHLSGPDINVRRGVSTQRQIFLLQEKFTHKFKNVKTTLDSMCLFSAPSV